MPRLPDPRFAPDCTVRVDGHPVPARTGESVAVALVAAGRPIVARSAKYHRPRGPFCLAGSCHACLARVDGVANERTCRAPCRDGLEVETQHGVPSARHDLLAAIDRVYPGGLDHHHLATWNALANRAAVAASRRLAGLGGLPSRVPPASPGAVARAAPAVVVGGGPAGLGAAEAFAQRGVPALLVESDRLLGGRLRARIDGDGDPPLAWVDEVARALASSQGEVLAGATVVGIWPDADGFLLAIGAAAPARLVVVRAPRVVVATGSFALPPLFPRNDLPGIYDARGLLRALAEHGVVPGWRVAVAGEGAEAEAAALRLAEAGVAVERVDEIEEAEGSATLAAIALPGGARVACDALAWAGPRSPASELARAAGAAAALDLPTGGYRLQVDGGGRARVPGLAAAGEVVAAMGAREAAAAGARAAESLLA